MLALLWYIISPPFTVYCAGALVQDARRAAETVVRNYDVFDYAVNGIEAF